MYGGRGAGAKSTSIATALLLSAAAATETILCCREYLKSIDKSVYTLLKKIILFWEKEKIVKQGFFTITRNEITCARTDSIFFFAGLHMNVGNIQSMHAVSKCWVEEAQYVQRASFDVLVPTIREPGSEIWLSFNPRFKEDLVYKTFVTEEPPPKSIIVSVTQKDNPWFPQVLKDEAKWLKKHDHDKYMHVYGGQCWQQSKESILSGVWQEGVIEEGQEVEVYYGLDFGYAADPTALVEVFIDGKNLYVNREIFLYHVELNDLPTIVKNFLGDNEVVCDSARPDIISHLKNNNINAKPAKKSLVLDHISYLRSFNIFINPECTNTLYEATAYKWKVNGEEILPIPVDKSNHCVDGIFYSISHKRKAIIRQASVGSPVTIGNPFRLTHE